MYKYKFDSLKLYLAETLFNAINSISQNHTIDEIYHQISLPPDGDFGHFTYPCFHLSKILRNSPNVIAKQLVGLVIIDSKKIEYVDAVGPYINFRITPNFLGVTIAENILSGRYFKEKTLGAPPQIMIEFSQPNTHKELHVGHMRNLCLGDSLVKIHQYCGFKVVTATFPGDVGTHVAKCLWYLKFHNKEDIPNKNKGAWLGTLYTKGHLKLSEEENTPQGEINKKQISDILSQLEAESGEFYGLWVTTREWSIELMNKIYEWADVVFDRWYWESEVNLPSVNYVKSNINNGVFIQSEGAIGVDLSEFNLGFCLLLKSDGNGLYATKDMELAKKKFAEYDIDKSINIVDKRQAHHFSQVFKVLELLGFEKATSNFHLQYDYVELPDGAMSSRKGNIVPILDLIEQMKETVKVEYLQRYINEWDDDVIENTADIISRGAIKYGMIKIDPNRKIIFDMKEWLKIDGDAGPYLQYTFARINSILKRLDFQSNLVYNWSALNENIEKNILVKLSQFNEQVVQACLNYKPNLLSNYLYELCKLYNHFYNTLSIKDAESELLKNSRVAISKCVAITLQKGLSLLGIPVPEKM